MNPEPTHHLYIDVPGPDEYHVFPITGDIGVYTDGNMVIVYRDNKYNTIAVIHEHHFIGLRQL